MLKLRNNKQWSTVGDRICLQVLNQVKAKFYRQVSRQVSEPLRNQIWDQHSPGTAKNPHRIYRAGKSALRNHRQQRRRSETAHRKHHPDPHRMPLNLSTAPAPKFPISGKF